MYKMWDKVKVKSWLIEDTMHGIIECTKEHVDAKGMEWEIINVFGDWQGYMVSFDPSLTFSEDMLELVESKEVKEEITRMNESIKRNTVSRNRRETVAIRLRTYQEMINKLEEVDRDMFFWMIYDKLESILFEEYWD